MKNCPLNRKTLRTHIRQQRNLLTDKFQQASSLKLVNQLNSLPQVKSAKNIAIYLTNDSELNAHLFIEWCWKSNIQTYLPVIHPFSKGQLLFLHYHASSVMQKNRYGILEPKLNVTDVIPTAQLDIIFTPVVAFDDSGARLGMGGGYYDRTLSTWFANTGRANKATMNKPYPIGLAHDCQLVDCIPTEPWDIPIPEIITPTQHFSFI
jgi:5-formyltetrahydrofolate cyclo-ligase